MRSIFSARPPPRGCACYRARGLDPSLGRGVESLQPPRWGAGGDTNRGAMTKHGCGLPAIGRLAAAICCAGLLAAPSALGQTPFKNEGAPGGALTQVAIGNDLGCQVAHTGDTAFEFFPSSSTPGDCGTFLFAAGTLFTPDFSSRPTATSGLGARTPFTPVSQTGVTGSGSASDPFRVTTVVNVGSTGLQIPEENTDNGAGISWSFSIPPGATVTRSHFTTFSPTGRAGPPPSASGTPPEPPVTGPRGNPLGLPTVHGCVDRRKFGFKLHHAPGRHVVEVDIFINFRFIRAVTGPNVKRLTLTRLPIGKFLVRLVATQDSGSQLISQRTYKGCKKSKPRTRRGHV